MNGLVFYSSRNTPGRHDSTGAFAPEARAFAHLHGLLDTRLIGVDCLTTTKAQRRKMVYNELKYYKDLECVAFFCHGWSSGVQFGFDFRTVLELAHELSRWRGDATDVSRQTRACAQNVTIVLYCCSTADGPDWADESIPFDGILGTPAPGTDGGFADQLRDAMCDLDLTRCRIVAHKTAGKATENPYVVTFDGDGTRRGIDEDAYNGGRWIVDPHDALWPKWRAALKTDFRFRFPFMSNAEIEQELKCPAP